MVTMELPIRACLSLDVPRTSSSCEAQNLDQISD